MTAVEVLGLGDIEVAATRIAETVFRTPCVASPSLTELPGIPVKLKLEHLQTS